MAEPLQSLFIVILYLFVVALNNQILYLPSVKCGQAIQGLLTAIFPSKTRIQSPLCYYTLRHILRFVHAHAYIYGCIFIHTSNNFLHYVYQQSLFLCISCCFRIFCLVVVLSKDSLLSFAIFTLSFYRPTAM